MAIPVLFTVNLWRTRQPIAVQPVVEDGKIPPTRSLKNQSGVATPAHPIRRRNAILIPALPTAPSSGVTGLHVQLPAEMVTGPETYQTSNTIQRVCGESELKLATAEIFPHTPRGALSNYDCMTGTTCRLTDNV